MTLQWSPPSRPVNAYNNAHGFSIAGGTFDSEDVAQLAGTVTGAGSVTEADVKALLVDLKAVLVAHGFSYGASVHVSTNYDPGFELLDL